MFDDLAANDDVEPLPPHRRNWEHALMKRDLGSGKSVGAQRSTWLDQMHRGGLLGQQQLQRAAAASDLEHNGPWFGVAQDILRRPLDCFHHGRADRDVGQYEGAIQVVRGRRVKGGVIEMTATVATHD